MRANMERPIVTNIPISPREHPHAGYFSVPFYADCIARMLGGSFVISWNCVGAKGGESHLSSLERTLGGLGIQPSSSWVDERVVDDVRGIVQQGLQAGYLSKQAVPVLRCPCGVTEMQDTTEVVSWQHFRRNTYHLVEGKPVCRICGGATESVMVPGILLHIPDFTPDTFARIDIFPEYADREITNHLHALSGSSVLITRTRPTALKLSVGDSEYGIDTDVFWQCWLLSLAGTKRTPAIAVSGMKTMRQLVSALVVTATFGGILPSLIIVTPYIDDIGEDGEAMQIEDLMRHYGVNGVRAWLGGVIGAKEKYIGNDVGLLKSGLFAASGQPPATLTQDALRELLDRWNRRRLQGMLHAMRDEAELSAEEAVVAGALFG